MATAVFFHAHPDDESIATGGTMAAMAADGHRVVLVTATDGALGEIPGGLLHEGETLVERRGAELAEACRLLGVSDHRFLGYGDSGMEGDPANGAPGCFWQADVEEAAAALAAILRAEDAEVLTIYDEHGNYGHPDHIQVHRVGARAAELARTPRVFMATQNRDHMLRLIEAGADFGFAPDEERLAMLDTLGVEGSRITAAVDVTGQIEAKRAAMAAHASQISETSFFLSMPEEVFGLVWGTEWYVELGVEAGTGPGAGLLD